MNYINLAQDASNAIDIRAAVIAAAVALAAGLLIVILRHGRARG